MKISLIACLLFLGSSTLVARASAAEGCWIKMPSGGPCVRGVRVEHPPGIGDGCGFGGSTLSTFFKDAACTQAEKSNACWFKTPETKDKPFPNYVCKVGKAVAAGCHSGGKTMREYYENNTCFGTPIFVEDKAVNGNPLKKTQTVPGYGDGKTGDPAPAAGSAK